ncbi:MAG: conjugal transfer protein TraN [Steroidobacteraceae bacterium]
MRDTVGLDGYKALATPGASGAAGAASTLSGQLEVNCALNKGTAESVAGVQMLFEGCQVAAGAVRSVSLSVCESNLTGGMCSSSGYGPVTEYPVGKYTALKNGYLGIGCENSAQTCLITVGSQYSIEGTGGQITAQANNAAAGQTTRQMLESTVQQVQPSAQTTATSQAEQQAAAGGEDQAYAETAGSIQESTPQVSTPNGQASFQNALVAAGTATAVSKSTSATGPAPIQVFAGQDMRCTTPLGLFGNTFSANCCELGLTQSANGLMGRCDQGEIKLAAERRARRTVYIGSYCSKERHLLFFSQCIQKTETYCAFGGILSRLIQEQGREQLAAAARAANGTAQSRAVSFPLYQGAGGWTQPLVLNGDSISIYEAPESCATSQGADGSNCPLSQQLWFAVCSKSGGCGSLPSDPQAGSTTWGIAEIDTLSATEQALSEHVIASGSCDSSSSECDYVFTAWPAASGGRVVLTKPLQFLATNPVTESSEVVIGNDVVKVTDPALSLGATWPASIPAQVSTDGGLSWRPFQLPLYIATPMSVAASGSSSFYGFSAGSLGRYWNHAQHGLTILGSCDTSSGVCQYSVTGEVTAIPMPWGTPKAPNCNGFSVSQLSMLDFSKMNLSQWVNHVSGESIPTQSQVLTQALSSARSGGAGASADTNPAPSEVAVVKPTEDMGPFTAVVSIAPWWQGDLQGPDPIYGVKINWGDCSPDTEAYHLISGGFRAYHTYRSPAAPGMCGEHGPAGPGAPRNLTEVITLWINAKDGVHTMTLQVRNDYYNYSAGD